MCNMSCASEPTECPKCGSKNLVLNERHNLCCKDCGKKNI